MNNEELEKKIFDIVAMSISEAEDLPFVETAEYVVDALIAAGIGDVKNLQAQVDALEMTNIALQAGYDGAEKDRLYWVDKYKEAERRAEKYERALELMARGECTFASPEYYKEQAEKELAEENNAKN